MSSLTDPDTIGACPCCGQLGGTGLAQAPALLAVCDVLVVQALKYIGKRLIRGERGRFRELYGRPFHQAHTLWTPDDYIIDHALADAWDAIPAMLTAHGCCDVTAGQVVAMLDKYVRDLAVTGTPHQLKELRYRFEKYLNIPLPVQPEPYQPRAMASGTP